MNKSASIKPDAHVIVLCFNAWYNCCYLCNFLFKKHDIKESGDISEGFVNGNLSPFLDNKCVNISGTFKLIVAEDVYFFLSVFSKKFFIGNQLHKGWIRSCRLSIFVNMEDQLRVDCFFAEKQSFHVALHSGT